MKHVRNLVTTSEALRRVFRLPLTNPSPLQCQLPRSTSLCTVQRRRIVTFSGGQYVKTIGSFGPKNAKRGPPLDEDIRSCQVSIVDSEGALKEPEALFNVLHSIDRDKFFVVQVSPLEDLGIPVCKIIEKQAFRKAERAKSKPAKNPHATAKQLELSWGIGPNDLGHRLNKLEQFLKEGRRVEILINPRKKARSVTKDEAQVIVQRIRKRIPKIEGAREWKDMLGAVGESVTIYVEGKVKKATEKEEAETTSKLMAPVDIGLADLPLPK